MEKFVMQGYVTKNAMQCYATENLVREDLTLHCIGQVQKDVQTVWKINFWHHVFSNFHSTQIWRSLQKMQNLDNFLTFWIHIFYTAEYYVLVVVWRKKTCFIQFTSKNRALNFRGVFFGPAVT